MSGHLPHKTHKYKSIDDLVRDSGLSSDVFDIDVQEEWKKFSGTVARKKVINMRWVYTVAAAAAVIVLFFALWVNKPDVYVADRQMTVTLADSSVVTLKKGSKLTVAADYGKSSRNVSLQGQGYFEVRHNPQKPFIVDAGDFSVQVKGTKFLVETGKKQVAVVSGLVQVATSSAKTLVAKGQMAEVSEESIKVENGFNPNLLAWQTGKIVFDNSPLDYVANVLSDVYGVKLQVEGAADSLRLTATFEQQDLNSVLEVISQVLDVKVARRQNAYVLYK